MGALISPLEKKLCARCVAYVTDFIDPIPVALSALGLQLCKAQNRTVLRLCCPSATQFEVRWQLA
ncbi:hypothetical protein [Vibrio navarrensis]|uniref:hypothetical protein n=1 Tax=Vibrio navarrensis TaxID=29495 RepID=UPI00186A56C5|nr:hypothetical protein [Vibrio navarrensis]